MNEKENAVSYYFENVTKKSWTWGKMTDEERDRFVEVLSNWKDKIKGNARARREQVCMIYDAFLEGIGYTGFMWRSENPSPMAPMF